jgi:hypothetical protein
MHGGLETQRSDFLPMTVWKNLSIKIDAIKQAIKPSFKKYAFWKILSFNSFFRLNLFSGN